MNGPKGSPPRGRLVRRDLKEAREAWCLGRAFQAEGPASAKSDSQHQEGMGRSFWNWRGVKGMWWGRWKKEGG